MFGHVCMGMCAGMCMGMRMGTCVRACAQACVWACAWAMCLGMCVWVCVCACVWVLCEGMCEGSGTGVVGAGLVVTGPVGPVAARRHRGYRARGLFEHMPDHMSNLMSDHVC